MVITDIVINVLLGRVTRHPAGMHCPAGDDASVSSATFASCCASLYNKPTTTGLSQLTRLTHLKTDWINFGRIRKLYMIFRAQLEGTGSRSEV